MKMSLIQKFYSKFSQSTKNDEYSRKIKEINDKFDAWNKYYSHDNGLSVFYVVLSVVLLLLTMLLIYVAVFDENNTVFECYFQTYFDHFENTRPCRAIKWALNKVWTAVLEAYINISTLNTRPYRAIKWALNKVWTAVVETYKKIAQKFGRRFKKPKSSEVNAQNTNNEGEDADEETKPKDATFTVSKETQTPVAHPSLSFDMLKLKFNVDDPNIEDESEPFYESYSDTCSETNFDDMREPKIEYYSDTSSESTSDENSLYFNYLKSRVDFIARENGLQEAGPSTSSYNSLVTVLHANTDDIREPKFEYYSETSSESTPDENSLYADYLKSRVAFMAHGNGLQEAGPSGSSNNSLVNVSPAMIHFDDEPKPECQRVPKPRRNLRPYIHKYEFLCGLIASVPPKPQLRRTASCDGKCITTSVLSQANLGKRSATF